MSQAISLMSNTFKNLLGLHKFCSAAQSHSTGAARCKSQLSKNGNLLKSFIWSIHLTLLNLLYFSWKFYIEVLLPGCTTPPPPWDNNEYMYLIQNCSRVKGTPTGQTLVTHDVKELSKKLSYFFSKNNRLLWEWGFLANFLQRHKRTQASRRKKVFVIIQKVRKARFLQANIILKK